MNNLKNKINIDIFADGADLETIKNFSKNSLIKGFTTNPSLMRSSGIIDYKKFAMEVLSYEKKKPISFEVFADKGNEMIEQRLDYIHQNPVKAGFVNKAEDFVYSSAMNYCGEKGLFDIDLID